MSNILKKEFEKVPYINYVPNDGRIIYLQAAYIEEKAKFNMFFPIGEGKITEIEGEPEQACYWSKSVVNPQKDFYFKLFHILANHFSYEEIFRTFSSMLHDIQNLGAVLHKQEILFEYYNSKKVDSTAIATIYKTEVEYLLGLVRSFFDLLHTIMAIFYNLSTKQELPDTIGKFVDNPLEKIIEKYKFPDSIKEYLEQVIPFIKVCRKMRDDIYHHGMSTDIIFVMENGPGVSFTAPPFSKFQEFVWSDQIFQQNVLPNNIGSLFYFFNKITKVTLETTDYFSKMILKTYHTPTGISSDYLLFVRGPQITYLHDIPNNLKKCWIKPIS